MQGSDCHYYPEHGDLGQSNPGLSQSQEPGEAERNEIPSLDAGVEVGTKAPQSASAKSRVGDRHGGVNENHSRDKHQDEDAALPYPEWLG